MALLQFASEKWSLGALVCPVPLEGRARVLPEYIPVGDVFICGGNASVLGRWAWQGAARL